MGDEQGQIQRGRKLGPFWLSVSESPCPDWGQIKVAVCLCARELGNGLTHGPPTLRASSPLCFLAKSWIWSNSLDPLMIYSIKLGKFRQNLKKFRKKNFSRKVSGDYQETKKPLPDRFWRNFFFGPKVWPFLGLRNFSTLEAGTQPEPSGRQSLTIFEEKPWIEVRCEPRVVRLGYFWLG